MKKILKVIMTLILICSCFYLAISLFMNHLIINDMVPTVVKSTAVTNRRYLSKCFKYDEYGRKPKSSTCFFFTTR